MNGAVHAVAGLTPLPPLQRNAAALDLDDRHTHAGPGDDQIGFPVLRPVAEPHVAEEDGVVRQLFLQGPSEEPLRLVGEPRLVGKQARRHARTGVAASASQNTASLMTRMPRARALAALPDCE